MSNDQLYDRIAVLRVYGRKQVTAGTEGTSLVNIDPTGRKFMSKEPNGSPGFRIKFHVEKTTGPVFLPNPSTVSIYNVGEDSRAALSKYGNLLILEAGYGKNSKVVFSGNILFAKTSKEGPDYITEIQAGEGAFAQQNTLVNQAFGQQTAASQIITSLVGALKGAGINPGISTGIPTKLYNKGYVLSGKALDKLKEVCEDNDLDFTIEKDQVIIVPYGGAKPNPPIFISYKTGLIGIPQVREQSVPSVGTLSPPKKLISFKILLNPDMGCFQSVLISSKFSPGVYTTAKVTHTGDTWGTEWFTECEAV